MRHEPWVSLKMHPLEAGQYKVKYRAAACKKVITPNIRTFNWDGQAWSDDKGERVPSHKMDFMKWFAASFSNIKQPLPIERR